MKTSNGDVCGQATKCLHPGLHVLLKLGGRKREAVLQENPQIEVLFWEEVHSHPLYGTKCIACNSKGYVQTIRDSFSWGLEKPSDIV